MLVPGAAVSPGAKTCNFAKAPGFTVIPGLTLGLLLLSVRLLVVRVEVAVVFRVTLKDRVPPTSAELAGKMALVSEEVTPMISVTFVTRFQLASTALTVMLKALPAV